MDKPATLWIRLIVVIRFFLRLLLLVLWVQTPVRAAIRLELPPESRLIQVKVDSDAPETISFESQDVIPIDWIRAGQRSAALPVVRIDDSTDLIIVDREHTAYALVAESDLPCVCVEPAAYTAISAWRGQPAPNERVRIVWLGVLFSLGVLLALLLWRYALQTAIAYCCVWIIALLVWQAHRPVLATREDAIITWYVARAPQVLRVPIEKGGRWIPVVETREHLRALSPRIEVVGSRAWIVLSLATDARIGFRAPVESGLLMPSSPIR